QAGTYTAAEANSDAKADIPYGDEHTPPRGTLRRLLWPAYPILVTAVYFAVGLIFGAWHPAWLIFMTIPVFYAGLADGFAILVAGIFLLIGFFWNAWHPGWLVFLTIPIFYAIFPQAKRKKDVR
ncbi:MAG: hypothetical protein LBQ91_00120, partial [Oscillospiraceae bacterium]|nr:hypothetical protein [Oscillospiraceae bacterium]